MRARDARANPANGAAERQRTERSGHWKRGDECSRRNERRSRPGVYGAGGATPAPFYNQFPKPPTRQQGQPTTSCIRQLTSLPQPLRGLSPMDTVTPAKNNTDPNYEIKARI